MTVIIGFDISTSVIGYSVIDNAALLPKVICIDCFKPPKNGNIFERLAKTQIEIHKILRTYKPEVCSIEQISKFMPKVSTAQTIIALARINIAVGLTCYNYLGHPPAMFSVMKIRHGLKQTKELPKKEEMPELLETVLGIKFPFVYENDEIAPETYDMADGLAAATYAAKYLQQLEIKLSARIDQKLPKLKLRKKTKERKELLNEYKEITGKDYGYKESI